jgi:proliferating cell nuclear antigen
MDSSHVALVSLNLSQDGFETFRADTNMVLGISIANLAKVMKLADNNDTITLQADQDASHLKITFENPKTERTTTFNLNLITLDSEHLAIPETEYSSVVSLNSGEFSKICRELYAMSETVTVTTNPDFVQFNVDSDIGSGNVRQFALRYLNMFNKASSLSNFTRLCLHSEQPLVVEFKIENLGVLKYFLAPKISDE